MKRIKSLSDSRKKKSIRTMKRKSEREKELEERERKLEEKAKEFKEKDRSIEELQATIERMKKGFGHKDTEPDVPGPKIDTPDVAPICHDVSKLKKSFLTLKQISPSLSQKLLLR